MTRAAPVDIDRFRREVRDFLKEHLPGWLRDKVLRHEPLVKADYLAWQRVLLERGWMCPTLKANAMQHICFCPNAHDNK